LNKDPAEAEGVSTLRDVDETRPADPSRRRPGGLEVETEEAVGADGIMNEADFLRTSGDAEGEAFGEAVERDAELRDNMAEVPRGILRVATVRWRRGFSVVLSESSKLPEERRSKELELFTMRL
jgi:hypothetical protein